jgi:hypothetical protein
MECIPRRNQPRIRKTGNSKIKIEKLLSRGAPEAEANGGRAVVVSSQGHCMLCPANILGALLPMHLAPCGVRRLAAAVCPPPPPPLLVRPRRHRFLFLGAQQEGPPGRRLVESGVSVAPLQHRLLRGGLRGCASTTRRWMPRPRRPRYFEGDRAAGCAVLQDKRASCRRPTLCRSCPRILEFSAADQ